MSRETNLEHYKERLKKILKEYFNDPGMIFYSIRDNIDPEIQRTSDFFTATILDWMAQEYKPEILDNVEKKYLREVIRPFRKEVKAIRKQEDPADPAGKEFIQICLEKDFMTFPSFEKGEMYEGLEPYKNYTPEELGL